MNEPPLGGHHLLPSWVLCNEVCTLTQWIEPISVSVSKKWREKEEICTKNRANERFAPKTAQTNEPPLGDHIVGKKTPTKNRMPTPWPKAQEKSLNLLRKFRFFLAFGQGVVKKQNVNVIGKNTV